MKERPIIMSGESVRATLADLKTQTRRVAVFSETPGQRVECDPEGIPIHRHSSKCPGACDYACGRSIPEEWTPYGIVGDRLWVKEGYAVVAAGARDSVVYRADGDPGNGLRIKHWRSPLFMPRAASRITLEITEVRVQRLQEISEHDALAETGCRQVAAQHSHVEMFASGWDAINAKRGYPWSANRPVFALTYRRLA